MAGGSEFKISLGYIASSKPDWLQSETLFPKERGVTGQVINRKQFYGEQNIAISRQNFKTPFINIFQKEKTVSKWVSRWEVSVETYKPSNGNSGLKAAET